MKKVIVLLVIFLSGCLAVQQSETNQAVALCKKLCERQKTARIDLSQGPCLSNEIRPQWVCDIAHSPRQEQDNDPANQCQAFRDGNAKHFVELDEQCEVIKTY